MSALRWHTPDTLVAGSPTARALYDVVAGRRSAVTLHWIRGPVATPDALREVYRELAAIAVHAAHAAAPFSVRIDSTLPHSAEHVARIASAISPGIWHAIASEHYPRHTTLALRDPGRVEQLWGLAVRFHPGDTVSTIAVEAHMVSRYTAHPDGVPLWLALAGARTESEWATA